MRRLPLAGDRSSGRVAARRHDPSVELHGYEQSARRCCLVTDAGAERATIARWLTLAARPEQARRRGHERRLLVVEQRERADLCRARGRSERPHQARSGVAVTCEWHRLVAAGAPRRRCRSRAGWGFLRSAAVAAMGRLWLEPATLGRERRCAFLVGVHAEITVGRDGRGGQQLRLLGVAGCVTG
jgi:hypothetical protein